MEPKSKVGHPTFLSKFIPNPKERKNIIFYLALSSCLAAAGILLITANQEVLMGMDEESYKEFLKQFGSIARIIYFVVLSIFPIFLLLKWKGLKGIKWKDIEIKPLVQFAGKLLRKWHVPLALLATAGVVLHAILAIIRDFHWDFTNITGIFSSITLFFLVIMGFKRFKRKDRTWHLKLAITFTIFFMIHASF
ncbi:hypothetical protein [Rossellomorea vietnamensis]|uniref:Uncharacterized protein n=1 Tax=Rossellomorea vietnamensis TaxID=218284 RepID=A0A0P6WNV0_9BACI|nr:hypothetical protein [Rossellomorea vietnamensis]KPL57932.1 hypothetical protein AM506_19625 [Rossellomorea vietnamensis]